MIKSAETHIVLALVEIIEMIKKCFYRGSKITLKYGNVGGIQRYKCAAILKYLLRASSYTWQVAFQQSLLPFCLMLQRFYFITITKQCSKLKTINFCPIEQKTS